MSCYCCKQGKQLKTFRQPSSACLCLACKRTGSRPQPNARSAENVHPLTDQLDSLDRRREPAKAGKEGVCRLRRQPHSSSSSSTCRSRVLQKSCFDSHCIRGVLEEAFVTDDVVLYSEKEVTCLQPSCHILECATSNKALIHAQFLCGPLAQ